MKNTKYNKIEKSLADDYLNKILIEDTDESIALAHCFYEWYITRQDKHDSRLRGLIKSIHFEEWKSMRE